MKTWRVLTPFPDPDGSIPLDCEHCGQEATVPTKGAIIIEGIKGMGVFHDPSTPPPRGYLPEEIQCRKCHKIYGDFGGQHHVR